MLTISATRQRFINDSIAYQKPATQSGVYGLWLDNVASRAVDGYTHQNLNRGYCAHPHGQLGQGSWWTVDLSDNDTTSFVIWNVTIYFRDIIKGKYQPYIFSLPGIFRIMLL